PSPGNLRAPRTAGVDQPLELRRATQLLADTVRIGGGLRVDPRVDGGGTGGESGETLAKRRRRGAEGALCRKNAPPGVRGLPRQRGAARRTAPCASANAFSPPPWPRRGPGLNLPFEVVVRNLGTLGAEL